MLALLLTVQTVFNGCPATATIVDASNAPTIQVSLERIFELPFSAQEVYGPTKHNDFWTYRWKQGTIDSRGGVAVKCTFSGTVLEEWSLPDHTRVAGFAANGDLAVVKWPDRGDMKRFSIYELSSNIRLFSADQEPFPDLPPRIKNDTIAFIDRESTLHWLRRNGMHLFTIPLFELRQGFDLSEDGRTAYLLRSRGARAALEVRKADGDVELTPIEVGGCAVDSVSNWFNAIGNNRVAFYARFPENAQIDEDVFTRVIGLASEDWTPQGSIALVVFDYRLKRAVAVVPVSLSLNKYDFLYSRSPSSFAASQDGSLLAMCLNGKIVLLRFARAVSGDNYLQERT